MEVYKQGIDIILPAYNAASLIEKALYSIAIQKKAENFNVYIVNDCSDYDYENFVNKFKKYYQITELKLEKNMGPGYARQYGIEHSNSEYIVFMDTDDYFYSPYSLYNLYKAIKENENDLVISDFYCEVRNEYQLKRNNLTWLHGKIYSRKFLSENNIKFNNSRANEDWGFNCLVRFHKPKTYILEKLTYMYSQNINSITRINNNSYDFFGLEGYANNLVWATNIALEKGLDLHLPVYTCFTTLVYLYTYYVRYSYRDDVNKIAEWGNEVKKILDKYKDIYLKDIDKEREIEKIKDSMLNKEEQEQCPITFDDFCKVIEEIKYDRCNNTSI